MNQPIKYTRAVFAVIVADALDGFMGLREYPRPHDDRPLDSVRIDDQGLWVHPDLEPAPHTELTWSYVCEMESGENDSLNQPVLRFPFTAAELAAFMLGGVGYFVRDRYLRGKEIDPDSLPVGVHSAQPREALEHAFEAHRAAENVVGPYEDRYVEDEATLRDRHDAHRRDGESNADWDARVRKFQAALLTYRARSKVEVEAAVAAHRKWRRAMVRQLLGAGGSKLAQPVPTRRQKGGLEAQRVEVIEMWLRAQGYDPWSLPPPDGKTGQKRMALTSLLSGETFNFQGKEWVFEGTKANFNTAWQALRNKAKTRKQ